MESLGALGNGALVSKVLEAVFVKRDPASVASYFSDNYIQHNPLIPNGKESIVGVVASLSADFTYEQGLIVADGDHVMVHGRYTGWGPAPLIAVDIFRVANGQIVEHWDVMQEEVLAKDTVSGNSMF